MHVKRSIGSIALFFTAIGSMVGSGWLFGPLLVAQMAGPAGILSWVIGGILTLFIAFTFAELSTAFPVTGGMVHFAEMSHGSLVSFTMGWMIWLSSVIIAPIETFAVLQYAANYIPGIMHAVGTTQMLTHFGLFYAFIVMGVMVLLNAFGAKLFAGSSAVLVVIKLAIPALIIVALFHLHFDATNFTSAGFMPNGFKSVMTALPLAGVIFSFIGYSTAIQLAGEAKNPQKAIPIAVIGSIAFCILLYTLLQTSFIGAIPKALLAGGWSNLSFTGDAGPIAGLLAGFGVGWLVITTYVSAFVSPFGTGFLYVAGTARTTYALSETGFFSKYWQKLNIFGMPLRAMILNFVVGMFFFLPFQGWQSLAGFFVVCFIISYSVGPIALYVLRKTKPNAIRPFKLPMHQLMCVFAFYICNMLLLWAGWATIERLIIASLVGFAVYVWRLMKNEIKAPALRWWQSMWIVLYFLGIGLLSYLSSFGGGTGLMPFGWDFVWVALFSIIVFFIAVKYHVVEEVQ